MQLNPEQPASNSFGVGPVAIERKLQEYHHSADEGKFKLTWDRRWKETKGSSLSQQPSTCLISTTTTADMKATTTTTTITTLCPPALKIIFIFISIATMLSPSTRTMTAKAPTPSSLGMNAQVRTRYSYFSLLSFPLFHRLPVRRVGCRWSTVLHQKRLGGKLVVAHVSCRIIRIPFTGSVKLRSLLLKTGPADLTPSKVTLVRLIAS